MSVILFLLIGMAVIGLLILGMAKAMQFKGSIGEFIASAWSNEEDDPIKQIEAAIASKRAKLAIAREGIKSSEEWVRHVEREHKRSQEDVNRLTSRMEAAVKAKNDGDARRHTERLLAEEKELANLTQQLEEAKSEHHESQRMVDEYQRGVRSMEQKVRQLKVRSNLAEAREEASGYLAEMATGTSDDGFGEGTATLEERIAVANASTAANQRLAGLSEPSDDEKTYLDTSDEEDPVEARLRAVREKTA